ncbi:MAG TPA: ester cyclase [Candidatus Competibacter sp.]|nr:hypothetical protein [Candidatus Competibacteraceae bacterium]HRE53518.1 ester cyclase [Candidatus Competibacter sp.]HUM94456.1 ester cyclase [Candidatus Competibacter sp.]
MPVSQNKAIVQRYIEAVWNQRQLDGIDTLFEENYTIHQNGQALAINREMLKQSIRTILSAFPDFHMALDSLVAEGDRVAAYWINSGTQTGELRLPDMPQSAPPSARTTTFAESALFRIAADKIAEVWYVSDRLSMVQGLGLISWAAR